MAWREKQGRLWSSTGAAVAAVGVVAISQADPVTRARLHAGRAKPSRDRGQQWQQQSDESSTAR